MTAAHLPAGIQRQGLELHGRGACHGAEVAVAHKVKRAHSAVQGGGQDCAAAGQEGHSRHRGSMLFEGDEAEAGLRVPQLDLQAQRLGSWVRSCLCRSRKHM